MSHALFFLLGVAVGLVVQAFLSTVNDLIDIYREEE